MQVLPGLSELHNWLLAVDNAQLDTLSVWFIAKDNILATYHLAISSLSQPELPMSSFYFPFRSQITNSLLIHQNTNTRNTTLIGVETAALPVANEHSLIMGLFLAFGGHVYQ